MTQSLINKQHLACSARASISVSSSCCFLDALRLVWGPCAFMLPVLTTAAGVVLSMCRFSIMSSHSQPTHINDGSMPERIVAVHCLSQWTRQELLAQPAHLHVSATENTVHRLSLSLARRLTLATAQYSIVSSGLNQLANILGVWVVPAVRCGQQHQCALCSVHRWRHLLTYLNGLVSRVFCALSAVVAAA